ncbi:MAG: cbb3-type cytochrome oxidase subunit 3 [Rhodothalassiaceae bacterium]
MDYHFLREFADSWMLLVLFVLIVGVWIWVFRPGTKKRYDRMARLPLDKDEEDEK